MNAVVEQDRDGMIVGDHGLETKNERGRLLIEFCQRNKLCIVNTLFKQPKRRGYTWKARGDCNRYQLDYIIVQNRYKNNIKNAHAYPGGDANSDHNTVRMKRRLHLKRPHRTRASFVGQRTSEKLWPS